MNTERNKFGVPALAGGSNQQGRTKVGTANEEREAMLGQLGAAARRKVLGSITKQQKLIVNLRGDLIKHGDPEKWKRYGDLLLANAGNASRESDRVLVTDYFDEAAPIVEIEGDANKSLSEIAEDYFRRYAKARNGLRVIGGRMAKAEAAIKVAEAVLRQIDAAVETADAGFL